MNRCTLALLAALLVVPNAHAEQLPSRTRGMSADSVYQIGDLDNVNLFNGNLTIAIPIGQSYSVSPQLSYRLALAYNSSVWDYDDELSCIDKNDKRHYFNFPYPAPTSNAGVGWSLHLGRLYERDDAIYNKNNPNWLYVAPDGSQHNLYEELHPNEETTAGVRYSNNGTYLRLDARDPSQVKVESQDGLMRTFSRAGGRYRLTQTADRFGNWMQISYAGSTWEITDSHDRSHTLTLDSSGQVTKVELAAFGDTTATYELSYQTASLERHGFDHPNCTVVDPLHTEFVSASLLSGVELPDGSSFAFTYDTIDVSGGPNFSGAIRSMVVPTGGRFEWDYGTYGFQSQAPELPQSSMTLQRGVGARRTYLQSSGGAVQGSWTYEQITSQEITIPGGSYHVACWHRSRVSDNLSKQVTESYFATAGGSDYWWYGLPYAPCDPITASTTFTPWSGNNASPYLSTRILERQPNGTLTPVRSTYVIYDSDGRDSGNHQDRNHRLRYQKVVYHDDLDGSGNPHQEETINSDFDGLGHYRNVSRKSSFGPEKIVATSFLPAGSYQLSPDTSSVITNTFDMPSIASPWIHGLSDGSTSKQGSLESKRETCFDSATGFLERQRILAGTSQQGKDVVTEFEEGEDQDGNHGLIVAERLYGGDSAATVPNGALCDLSLSSPSYDKKNAYQYGSLSRSAWVEPCNEFDEILVTEEVEIDQRTGLVKAYTETNGLQGNLYYDIMGRLLADVPAEGASITHKYVVSPPSYEVQHCPQGHNQFCQATQRLSSRYWEYDGLGRVARKAMAYPGESGETIASLNFKLDGIGRKIEESTWGGTHKTDFKNFDVFGRARSIEPQGTHSTLLTFHGERIKAREVKVATSEGSVQSVFSTEVHDHLGRLVAICEAGTTVWNGSAGSCTGQRTRSGVISDS